MAVELRMPDAPSQRLDLWLWHARVRRVRADCARLVAAGAVRINRRPTDKPHALVRPGDVLGIALGDQVRIVRIMALAARRGPATEARALYDEIPDEPGAPPLDPDGALRPGPA